MIKLPMVMRKTTIAIVVLLCVSSMILPTMSSVNSFQLEEHKTNFKLSTESDNVSVNVSGCTNVTANNYDQNATMDDGSCDFDLDDDGILDADEIPGCTDSRKYSNFAYVANNYNPHATDDDGSCDYDLDDDGVLDVDEVRGCTDSRMFMNNQYLANNYDPNATDNDGSCDYDLDNDGINDIDEKRGCTSIISSNYDPTATDDDGSCYGTPVGGFKLLNRQMPYQYTTSNDNLIIDSKFSPDGTQYATLHDSRVIVWSTSSRTIVDTFSFSSTWNVFDLDWSPDGKNISTIMNARSTAGVIKSWIITHTFGVENYSYVALENGTHYWGEIEYSPDGSMIAVAYDRFTAIYDSTNGEELWNLTSPQTNYYNVLDNNHFSVSWSPDGLILAASIGITVYMYDVNSMQQINHIIHGSSGYDHYISSLTFSPDGTKLAYCSNLGESYLRNVSDGRLLWKINYDSLSSCTDIAWSPDSQRIATSYSFNGDHASAVVVQYAEDGSMLDRFGALRVLACEDNYYYSHSCGVVEGVDWHNNGDYIIHSVSGYNAGIYHWEFDNTVEVIFGCTVESATNYDPSATTYDASCIFESTSSYTNNGNNGGAGYYYNPGYDIGNGAGYGGGTGPALFPPLDMSDAWLGPMGSEEECVMVFCFIPMVLICAFFILKNQPSKVQLENAKIEEKKFNESLKKKIVKDEVTVEINLPDLSKKPR